MNINHNVKKCKKCNKEFKPVRSFSLYCSTICRSRFNQIKNGKGAKPFKCQNCGKLFKRRSAKNTKCLECRELLSLGSKLAVNFADYPKTEREEELKMQEDWLKKNKVTVI